MKDKKAVMLWAFLTLTIVIGFSACLGMFGEKEIDKASTVKPGNYAITFDANGGEFSGRKTHVTVTSSVPRFIGRDYPRPIFPAYAMIFNGYYTSQGNGRRVSETDMLVAASEGFTVYAQWQTKADTLADLDSFLTNFVAPRLAALVTVTGDITLPQGTELIDLQWESNDPSHLTSTGKVTQPLPNQSDAVVTLTATVIKGSQAATRNFTVTVLKEPDYEGLANADIDAAIAFLTASFGDLSAVTKNLTLLASVGDVAITWRSSNTAYLSNTGAVTRPASGESPASITLTATLKVETKKGPVTRTHDFTVTIMPTAANQDEQDVEDAIYDLIALLGDLSKVVVDITLPATGSNGVSISWSSNDVAHLSDTGVVVRPSSTEANATVILTATLSKNGQTRTNPFLVTVVREPKTDEATYAPIATKIKKADVALGDLSTVAANISLPASDAAVTVSWLSSDTAQLSISGNTGTVSRPSGSNHAELNLTGVFASIADPSEIAVKVYPVRIMRSGAAWDEFLNVHYKVEGGVFKNVAYSGDYYQPTLMGNASIGTVGGYSYVDVDSNGYIDLGERVGALLRKPNFYVEFYVRVTGDTGTMLSFANDANINNTNASPWRGTVLFSNPGLYFRAANHGAVFPSNPGTEQSADEAAITGNSGGIGGRTNQWVNLGLMKTGNNINIMRNWGRAQSTPGTNISRITTSEDFGSGDEEEYDLRYGYLGRSVLVNSGYTTQNNMVIGTPNAYYYEIKVYSNNFTLVNTTEHPNMAAKRAEKKAMNDACGYNDTN